MRPDNQDDQMKVQETRIKPRFLADPPLPAKFAGHPVNVSNVSIGGLQIMNTEPFRISMRGEIQILLPSKEIVAFRAMVVWSRISQQKDAKGRLTYRSGLIFDEPMEPKAGALGRLMHACGRPDVDSLERKRMAMIAKLNRRQHARERETAKPLNAGEREKLEGAVHLFRSRPEEVAKWYERARYSQAKSSGKPLPYQADIVAIWEYLGQSIPLVHIATAYERAVHRARAQGDPEAPPSVRTPASPAMRDETPAVPRDDAAPSERSPDTSGEPAPNRVQPEPVEEWPAPHLDAEAPATNAEVDPPADANPDEASDDPEADPINPS